ncbi:trypco2 family protein [Streptomyces katrae]|uniref:trypco2 family protein n=1 Tax=Streptomyces katrae TaxID=68223 RepID=UPI000697E65B|nr:trypco2 family protein [Streptomyces katrae]
MEQDGTELAEALKAVRAGLSAAQQEGDGAAIRFKVKEVTLDLGIELRAAGGASGGVKAFVVSTEAKGEWSRARTHRLTVNLEIDGSDHVLISGDATSFGETDGENLFE